MASTVPTAGTRRSTRRRSTPSRHAVAVAAQIARGRDADVEAGAVEQIAHRDDQPVRQQQHVEEQRADGGDAEDAERGAGRLPHQAAPGKAQRRSSAGQRSALRRSSSHEATTVAETPSGTAISTQVSATDGVTWTKSSAVS